MITNQLKNTTNVMSCEYNNEYAQSMYRLIFDIISALNVKIITARLDDFRHQLAKNTMSTATLSQSQLNNMQSIQTANLNWISNIHNKLQGLQQILDTYNEAASTLQTDIKNGVEDPDMLIDENDVLE
jgi:hypothetical protein